MYGIVVEYEAEESVNAIARSEIFVCIYKFNTETNTFFSITSISSVYQDRVPGVTRTYGYLIILH